MARQISEQFICANWLWTANNARNLAVLVSRITQTRQPSAVDLALRLANDPALAEIRRAYLATSGQGGVTVAHLSASARTTPSMMVTTTAIATVAIVATKNSSAANIAMHAPSMARIPDSHQILVRLRC